MVSGWRGTYWAIESGVSSRTAHRRSWARRRGRALGWGYSTRCRQAFCSGVSVMAKYLRPIRSYSTVWGRFHI